MIGKTISHYRITRKLGAGGMGVVYEALDTRLDRPVALKFLPTECTSDPHSRARFIHEARAASALDHPNICTVYEIDETDDGQIFLAMACYRGETLKERIARGPLPLGEASDITRQVADGLAKAHEREIVHRDIKPANVFLTADGLVKILDFGLAKLEGQTKITRTGTTLGTASYMSPEQARGEKTDRRSDLWSLGVMLYEMVTGRVPFPGEKGQGVIHGILNAEPEPVTALRTGVPLELERMIGKCLAKDPKERYQHVDDLLADLRRLHRESTSESAATTLVMPHSRPARKPYVLGTLAATVIIALVVTGIILMSDQSFHDRASVAVLPFKSIVTEPGYEWFGDGMTEAIISHLTKIENLKVTSSTSTMQFRDTDLPLGEIAAQLGVATILEGSVQQSGGQVHLMVKLIEARTDDHLWAAEYHRDLTDVFAVQTDIAMNVVDQLKAELTVEVTERIKARPTENLEAYKLLMEGRRLWRGTYEDRNRALELFEQATRIDPEYAEAYQELAEKCWSITVYGHRPPREMVPRAKAYALRTLEIDESNTGAHWTLGFIMSWWERDWPAAEKHWLKALELSPGDVRTLSGYAWHLLITGHCDDAVATYRRVLELSPLAAGIQQNMGEILYYARRYDESIVASRRAIKMDPTFPQARTFLGLAYHSKNMHEEALSALHADLELSQGLKPEIDNIIGAALAMVGDHGNARAVLGRLLERSRQGWASPASIAAIHMELGEVDRGFALLEKADEERDPRLVWLRISPFFDGVRSDPRYLELLGKAGFTD